MSVNVYENGQLKSIAGSGGGVEVIDNLNSTDIDKALSANQGRVLNENKLDINLENIDDSGIEKIKEIAGGGVPENIVLHSPSEEEVEVPPIDADMLGGELPEHYENELYLANESTPSTPTPRDADMLGGQLPSYYAKQSDVNYIFSTLNEMKIKSITIDVTTDGNGMVYFTSYQNTKVVPLLVLHNGDEYGWICTQISTLSDSGIGFRFTNAAGEPFTQINLNLTIIYIVNN